MKLLEHLAENSPVENNLAENNPAANLAPIDASGDEELVAAFHGGDNDAQDILIHQYKSLVKFCAREYFMIGADREDIIQEGMIGLYKAIRDYNPERGVPFYYFAQLCVTRQIISAVKAATRQKHTPLNVSVSLNKPIHDDDSYLETLTATRANPEELFIGKEEKAYIETHVGEILSDMECRVLALHLQGRSYASIAKTIGRDEKAVDNAVQRVRRKLEKLLRRKESPRSTSGGR